VTWQSGRFRVEWSDEDGEYVGTCDGFPSLSCLAPTANQAMHGIRRLVRDADLTDLERFTRTLLDADVHLPDLEGHVDSL
jgi:hypothetical protein